MFDTDVALWEQEIERLVEDSKFNVLIPLLTRYSSGMTDKIGLHLLKLAKIRIISISEFGVLGTAIDSLSDEVFTAWIEFLLGFTDKSVVSIALDLYHRYYILRKSAPTLSRNLTFRLLSHPSLFEESDGSPFNPMATGYWSDITEAFLNLDPKKGLELAKLVLNHFGEEGSIFNDDPDICAVLTEITKRYPAEVWDHVSKLLENQNFSRTFALKRWLVDRESSEEGALTLIPREKIWEWIDGEVDTRAWYFAHVFLPTTLSAEEWPNSMVREFLVLYGSRKDVRSTLISNYSTEVFWGPTSLHYEEKKQKLLRIKAGEDNENVKRWIDEYVEELEAGIEYAKLDEEREF